MRSFLSLAALASVALAHYTFPDTIYNGVKSGDWQNVRTTSNYWSHGPVQDVTSQDIRCYQNQTGNEGATTIAVKAGSTFSFTVDPSIQHPGPLSFYLAKAPSGQTASSFDGSGNVWFKIYQEPAIITSSSISWASSGKTTVDVTIPTCIQNGDYLLRVEHIGLHAASSSGGAQFYIGCAQITVSGATGAKSPAGVALPGAYKATDPGILLNIYWPIPTSYTPPGPAAITC